MKKIPSLEANISSTIIYSSCIRFYTEGVISYEGICFKVCLKLLPDMFLALLPSSGMSSAVPDDGTNCETWVTLLDQFYSISVHMMHVQNCHCVLMNNKIYMFNVLRILIQRYGHNRSLKNSDKLHKEFSSLWSWLFNPVRPSGNYISQLF
jgi:hypothetical protein